MSPIELLTGLVYLDRGYIADLYEVATGESPQTTVTKNQGTKAGARIPVFSAEVSAQETRSFPVSTFEMLRRTLQVLEAVPPLKPADFQSGMRSAYGWIEGELTTFQAKSSVERHSGEMETLASAGYFQLRQAPGVNLALITTPEYFAYGLDTLLKMQETLLQELSLPVRALVRVIAAQSYTKQWVAIPLLVLERDSGERPKSAIKRL